MVFHNEGPEGTSIIKDVPIQQTFEAKVPKTTEKTRTLAGILEAHASAANPPKCRESGDGDIKSSQAVNTDTADLPSESPGTPEESTLKRYGEGKHWDRDIDLPDSPGINGKYSKHDVSNGNTDSSSYTGTITDVNPAHTETCNANGRSAYDRDLPDIEDCAALDPLSADETKFSDDEGVVEDLPLTEEEIKTVDDKNTKSPNYPVDTGYAWVIVLASFCLQTLLLGYSKTMGLFFVEFQSRFGSSASMTSLIIGMAEGVGSVGSLLIMGVLLRFVPPRVACFIGSFCLSAGVVGNSLVTDGHYLLITHGILFGMAMAALYGPTLIVLTQYFDKRRALATSIATCGTSFGGMVFPLLVRRLLDEYAFQGGILMTAALLVHSFVFSALLTPIEAFPDKLQKFAKGEPETEKLYPVRKLSTLEKLKARFKLAVKKRHDICQNDINENENIKSHDTSARKNSKTISDHRGFTPNLETCQEGVALKIGHNYTVSNNTSLKGITITDGDNVVCEYVDGNGWYEDQHKKLIDVELMEVPPGKLSDISGKDLKCSKQVRDENLMLQPSYFRHTSQNESQAADQRCSTCDVEAPLQVTLEVADIGRRALVHRQLSHLSTSAASIFCSTSSLHTNFADIMSVDTEGFNATLRDKPKTFVQRFCTKCRQSSLIRAVSFWVLTAFFFCTTIGQTVPNIYIPALAKERGLSEDEAAFSLSLLNMLDFPSRIVAGLVVNFGLLRPTTVCIGPMLFIGVIGHLTPLFHTYGAILSLVVVYGLFGGIYYAMQSLIVIEVLGMEHFASAIGFYYLAMGFGGAVSFPIAGALKDITGTYSTPYHYLATAELVALCLLLILPFAKKYDLRRGVLKDTEDP